MERNLNVVISNGLRSLMENYKPVPLSQGKLARMSGVAQATICMNLKGERGWSIDILEKICRALGVSVAEMITEGGKNSRKLRLAEIAKEKNEMLKELARLRRTRDEASEAVGDLLDHWVELGHEEDRLQDEEDRLNPKKEEDECDD